ncbi:Wzz/FepE/Etk N-terminal domain-containing protein [Pseudoruegeria sp. SK021]|uniref:GumC family protein n=1 Tax=Pseudoruegeria sp. SK021 TaxID=1933035 RepID=UPI000A23715C|nr:Wzz/FepE/Etk N-terminal domain-containing protein [Pseudoruegeria sp. SK021]OSP53863.1 hypothetical protein BV911_15660 [Pseudoruegeria sp. SK021]
MIHRNSDELHFRQIATLVRRRWLLIGTMVLLGGGLAAAAGILLQPRYTAKAQILYETEVQDGVTVIDETAVETLVEMLISPNHVHRLSLSLKEGPGPTPIPTDARGGTDVNSAQATADGASLPPPDLGYEALNRGLNAYKERQSRLIAVTFTMTNPETAAFIANRAVELFLELEEKYQRERRAYALRLIEDRIPKAQAEFDQSERALRAHKIEFGQSDTTGLDMTDRQIADLNRQLMIARSDLELREARVEQRRMDVHLASGSTDVDDTVATDRAELEGLILDRDLVEARLRDIERRLEIFRRGSFEATESWTRLRELEREAAAAGQNYESLLRRSADLSGNSGLRPSARLITTASIPNEPSSPNPMLFVVPAMVASLIVGGMMAALVERLDQRLRGERDIEVALGVPCIGLVPKVTRIRRAPALRRLLHDHPFDAYTEAIRGLFVTTTWRSTQGIQPTTLLVTSCANGEGKTTLVVSLAIYAARLKRRVLVIDLDFRSPGLRRVLGEVEDHDIPADGSLPWDASQEAGIFTVKGTGIDYFSVTHTGNDPLSVLTSDGFPKLLSRLRETYDYILIDSGPVVSATETRLLASMVDRVILTVKWGVTNARAGITAMQHIRATGTDQPIPVAVVINQVKPGVQRRRRYSEPGQTTVLPQTNGI